MVYRVFVEKKPGLRHAADSLKEELRAFLGIRELTPDALRQTAGFVLKNNEDLEVLASQPVTRELTGHCGHCGEHTHD